MSAVMTEDSLIDSKSRGNDLTTPRLKHQFSAFKAEDSWCLSLDRWGEVLDAGFEAPVVLEATHASVCEFVEQDMLKAHGY